MNKNTAIDQILGVYSPEAEFILATWMEKRSGCLPDELDQELNDAITKLGLEDFFTSLNEAVAATLLDKVIDLIPVSGQLKTPSPEVLLTISCEARVYWDECFPDAGPNLIESCVEYYRLYLEHYNTHFVVRDILDDDIDGNTANVLAAFTDKTPSIPQLMTVVERDWVKLAYDGSQLPWIFKAGGGELDGAVKEKLATSEWPSRNSFTA